MGAALALAAVEAGWELSLVKGQRPDLVRVADGRWRFIRGGSFRRTGAILRRDFYTQRFLSRGVRLAVASARHRIEPNQPIMRGM